MKCDMESQLEEAQRNVDYNENGACGLEEDLLDLKKEISDLKEMIYNLEDPCRYYSYVLQLVILATSYKMAEKNISLIVKWLNTGVITSEMRCVRTNVIYLLLGCACARST